MPPENIDPVSHISLLEVAGYFLLALLIVVAGVTAVFFMWHRQPGEPRAQAPAARAPAPTTTLGGSIYTQVTTQANPLKDAPAAVNPFDSAYKNPFAQ